MAATPNSYEISFRIKSLYFYIRSNKGPVAQNIRGKTPSDMGQNARHKYFAHKTLWASCPTSVSVEKSINKFLSVHELCDSRDRVSLTNAIHCIGNKN